MPTLDSDVAAAVSAHTTSHAHSLISERASSAPSWLRSQIRSEARNVDEAMQRRWRRERHDERAPKAPPSPSQTNEELRIAFSNLVRVWRRETSAMSLVSRKVQHPAYKQIVAMGWSVVPLLLHELEHTSAHFDIALREITGANPVPASSAGDMRRVVKAWLKWGHGKNMTW